MRTFQNPFRSKISWRRLHVFTNFLCLPMPRRTPGTITLVPEERIESVYKSPGPTSNDHRKRIMIYPYSTFAHAVSRTEKERS